LLWIKEANQKMSSAINLDYSLAGARGLDAADPLAAYRNEFMISDPELVYVDGNSLGRLPRKTISRVHSVLEREWGDRLVQGWNTGWYEAPLRLGDKLGVLLGAAPGQVLIADSTSVNLFKLVCTALALRPDRSSVVSDVLNFPSDLYVLQGCLRLLGGDRQLALAASQDEIHPDEPDLDRLINKKTAVVSLSHVAFKSGFLYDMQAVTQRAHQVGALVLWDLSHSAGVVPLQLDAWGVDLAVGCTYKYLNGGPGSPGYLYVRRELQEQALSPIWGWFGQNRPFAFSLDYQPADGITRFQAGTPPMLSLMAVEASLDLHLEAGIQRIRKKSEALTTFAIALVDQILTPFGFRLGSPRDPAQRGSHIILRHPEGYRINRALIEEMKVLPDFREPDNIRLGFAPLYTTFEEVWQAIDRLRRVVAEHRYQKYPSERSPVT
jgi:kynureninase